MLTFAEWSKTLTEEVRGEYWITDDGQAYFMDGDIGDQNHESYVIDIVQRRIIDATGEHEFDRGDYVNWVGFLEKIERQNPNANYEEVLEKEFNVSPEDAKVATGGMDARKYAMKNWRWKAMRGEHVESWTLTPWDMKVIARGIENVLDEEGSDDYENDDEREFVVSAYGKGHVVMTLAQLKNGGVAVQANPQATQMAQWNAAMQKQGNELQKSYDHGLTNPTYQGSWRQNSEGTLKTFTQYVEMLDSARDMQDQLDTYDHGEKEPEDFVKLKKFLLMALVRSQHTLIPSLMQVASTGDNAGEMGDYLHNIDWVALKEYAKKALKKWDADKTSKQDDDEEDDDTQPVNSKPWSSERMDRVKLPGADSGYNDQGGGEE